MYPQIKKYKVKWRSGVIKDNVWISDGAVYTWEDVAKILVEY